MIGDIIKDDISAVVYCRLAVALALQLLKPQTRSVYNLSKIRAGKQRRK